MTQMGLDYQKHLENKRHNVVSEGIQQQTADASTSQAQTQSYLASYKGREVAAKEKEADAKMKSAEASAYEASFADEKLAVEQQKLANEIEKVQQNWTSLSLEDRKILMNALSGTKLRIGNAATGYVDVDAAMLALSGEALQKALRDAGLKVDPDVDINKSAVELKKESTLRNKSKHR